MLLAKLRAAKQIIERLSCNRLSVHNLGKAKLGGVQLQRKQSKTAPRMFSWFKSNHGEKKKHYNVKESLTTLMIRGQM